MGDATVAAAKANGGVTEVTSIEHTSTHYLGAYAEFCTIVRGR